MSASTRARAVARRPSTMWSSLPGAQQLEVCAFLDPRSLGRLELCGSRQFEEARARAWMQAAAGTPRGALATLPSDKKFLAAHTQLRSLYPTSMQQARGFGDLPRDPDDHALFEDFAFTFVISWEEFGGDFHTAAFEHMRCNDPRLMRRFGNISTFCFAVSDADPGRNILKRPLFASQNFADNRAFTNYWQPVASQYCTRKRDGVTIKIAEWECIRPDINSMGWDELGSISFENGLLNLDHAVETYSTLNLLFEKATGRLRCLTSTHFEDYDDLENCSLSKLTFRALLLAKFEDATADNPPVPAWYEALRAPRRRAAWRPPPHKSQWRPGDVRLTGLTRDYTHL